MKKIWVGIIFMVFIIMNASSQHRSIEEAYILAKNCLTLISDNTDTSILRHEIKANASSKSVAHIDSDAFYIFSDTVQNAFVIVSGDKRMKDVLAYSNNAAWDNENIPDALQYLLELYKEQFDHIQNALPSNENTTHETTVPDVQPLIKSTWSQEAPFNNLCPSGCPSGCVATAMSQIMNLYKYPLQGTGYFSYISSSNKYNCSFDFGNTIFDWDNIYNSYNSSFANGDAVAELTYACGVSVGMDYAKSGSGAYMADVSYALTQFFKYNKNTTYRYRPYFSTTEWYQMLCDELQAGRPVLYGGVDSNSGGHAFIIDGCSSEMGMFHINWGWGGAYDGYYKLEALDPEKYKFSTYQDMVINISTTEVGKHDDVFYAETFIASSPLKTNKDIEFKLSEVYNYSNSSSSVVPHAQFKGSIGVGLFDSNFTFLVSLDAENVEELNSYYGYKELGFTVNISESIVTEDGKYYIAPYALGEHSKTPTRIRTLNAATDYLSININGDSINSDDNEEEVDYTYMLNDSFEDIAALDEYEQVTENGNSKWSIRTVLLSSPNVPKAADGKSYIYLEHKPSFPVISTNDRAITKFITEKFVLDPDSTYSISFMSTSIPDTLDVRNSCNIYYELDGEWKLLNEHTIANNCGWNKYTSLLSGIEKTRLAIEGDIATKTSLCLDDLRLSVTRNTTNAGIEIIEPVENAIVFDTKGVIQPVRPSKKGLYIIKSNDNRIKKVFFH